MAEHPVPETSRIWFAYSWRYATSSSFFPFSLFAPYFITTKRSLQRSLIAEKDFHEDFAGFSLRYSGHRCGAWGWLALPPPVEQSFEKDLVIDDLGGVGQAGTGRSAAMVRNTFTSYDNQVLANSAIDYYLSTQRDSRADLGLGAYRLPVVDERPAVSSEFEESGQDDEKWDRAQDLYTG